MGIKLTESNLVAKIPGHYLQIGEEDLVFAVRKGTGFTFKNEV